VKKKIYVCNICHGYFEEKEIDMSKGICYSCLEEIKLEEKLLKEFKDRYAFWRHEGYSPEEAKEKAICEMLSFRMFELFKNKSIILTELRRIIEERRLI